eukprot:6207884-Pleurochrysis_carterae.AAC.1
MHARTAASPRAHVSERSSDQHAHHCAARHASGRDMRARDEPAQSRIPHVRNATRFFAPCSPC